MSTSQKASSKIPAALLAWAKSEVKRHPMASDAHPIVLGCVAGGSEIHPDVTVGDLKQLVAAADVHDAVFGALKQCAFEGLTRNRSKPKLVPSERLTMALTRARDLAKKLEDGDG